MDYKLESNACSLSDTDLFTAPFTQIDIQHGHYEEKYPISKLSDEGAIEFSISNSGEHFLDLANSFLYLKIQILKGSGANLSSSDSVAPINNIVSSLFSQIDVTLNGTLVSTSNNLHAYQSYLETLLNYGGDSKNSQLQLGLYAKDQDGGVGEHDPKNNTALKERVELFKSSNVVEVIGKIHSDLFHQGKLILNGVPIKISMHRNRAEFCLLSTADNADFKIAIVEAVLKLRKVQLTPHKFVEIQKNLEKSPVLYPIDRIEMRVRTVPAGLNGLTWTNVFSGTIPTRLIIGIVENEGYSGNYKKNPFNFEHCNARSIGVSYDGELTPAKKIKLDFSKGHYLNGYQSLFEVSGKFGHDAGFEISKDDYKDGYTMYGFDISQSMCNTSNHQEPTRRGDLKIEIEFQKALSKTVTVIVYADFDAVISIDKFRNVLKHY